MWKLLDRFTARLQAINAPEEPESRQAAPEDLAPVRRGYSTDDDLVDDHLSRAMLIENLEARAVPRTVADDRILSTSGTRLAMDSADEAALTGVGIKALRAQLGQTGVSELQLAWYASQGFIGHQLMAIIAQHWLVQKACFMPAQDAVRKGFELTATAGEDIPTEVLDAIKAGDKRYKLKYHLRQFIGMGRVFGIRVALCKIASQDPDFYVNPFNIDGVTPGSYRGIVQIDPYWIQPELSLAASSDPAALDFYEPTYWIVDGKRYHKSHLIIFKGPEVADILKPSYLYGGLSIPQQIYERVYATERALNEAPALMLSKRATIWYMADLTKRMKDLPGFRKALEIWARLRDNWGVKTADAGDKIEQHDTSLSDVDTTIMSQAQFVASIAGVPATKLLGTQPKGFNSSGDYERDTYHETVEGVQEEMDPLVDRHHACMIRSDILPRFAEMKPFRIGVTWEPLAVMTEKEREEVRKLKAETDKVLAVDIMAVAPEEVRAKWIEDKDGGFAGLPPAPAEQPPEDDSLTNSQPQVPANGQAPAAPNPQA